MTEKVCIHRQCQLESVISELKVRFSKTAPNSYDLQELFRLHGLYLHDLTAEEFEYLNERVDKNTQAILQKEKNK